MRITNNMVTEGLVNEMQQLDSQQTTLQGEVSSGLAVSQPSDNPEVYGQVVELEGQGSQLAQYAANAATALNLAQASSSGLNSLTQIYDQASQTVTQASGADAGSSQDYADALDQLIQQAVSVANSQYAGSYLYAGTAQGQPPFATTTNAQGQITAVNYVGNDSQTAIPVSANTNIPVSTSGTTNSGLATIINNMIAARDALNAGSSSGLATAQTNLTSSEDVLTSAVADNGAAQLRIQSEQTQQQANATEVESSISSDTSANLTTAITQLSQIQLAYQAALETASKVETLSIVQFVNVA
jgi:flagellar hook-associated protein 3 FlgL